MRRISKNCNKFTFIRSLEFCLCQHCGFVLYFYTSPIKSIGVAKGGPGPPPPIEMLLMIKMSQKRLLCLQFQFLLAFLRTTVKRTTLINNNIDPGGPGPLDLILANQLKWAPHNNIMGFLQYYYFRGPGPLNLIFANQFKWAPYNSI